MTIAYRLATKPDLPFVMGGWLSTFRTAHAAGLISMERYESIYTEEIFRLMRRPKCDVVVAFFPEETDHVADLAGFLCAERLKAGPVVHYVYTAPNYRKEGIARGMFAAAEIDPGGVFTYTFKTGVVTDLRRKMPRATYNPLCARFESEKETVA